MLKIICEKFNYAPTQPNKIEITGSVGPDVAKNYPQ